jgi:hypothetical protein
MLYICGGYAIVFLVCFFNMNTDSVFFGFAKALFWPAVLLWKIFMVIAALVSA